MNITNEINGFRKQHRKSVEPKDHIISPFDLNKNNNSNNEDKKKEDDKEELINDNEDENKEIKKLYNAKLSSCKQVRLKKFL